MVDVKGPKMTQQTQLVLRELIADPTAERYGLELGQAAGLANGTVQPILARLERCGWVESRWEDENPHEIRRPRRRYYRLTSDGAVYAARALQRAQAPPRLVARFSPRPAAGGAQ